MLYYQVFISRVSYYWNREQQLDSDLRYKIQNNRTIIVNVIIVNIFPLKM